VASKFNLDWSPTTMASTNECVFRGEFAIEVSLSDEVSEAAAKSPSFAVSPSSSSSVFTTKIEVSAFTVSSAFKRELQFVFPEQDLSGVIAVPTFQQTVVDLVAYGGDQDVEKDRCLEAFFAFAKPLCQELQKQGFFADFIDPCSGLPMLTPNTQKVFDEVQSAQVLMSYHTMNTGCCKVLLHPVWGSSVYPATLFTTAPVAELVRALEARRS